MVGGEQMASYLDWMLIENPNELDDRDLRKAVSSMGAVANKRLKRMENAGISFGNVEDDNTISGVKKFSVRGKSISEVKREFKRVKNFLENPQSSLTGMWKTFSEVKRKWGKPPTRRMRKDFSKMKKQKTALGLKMEIGLTKYEELQRWRKTWDYYNRLINEGIWAPTEYDSNQVRNMIYSKVKKQMKHSIDDETIFEEIEKSLNLAYEKKIEEDEKDIDVSTSSLINYGPSI